MVLHSLTNKLVLNVINSNNIHISWLRIASAKKVGSTLKSMSILGDINMSCSNYIKPLVT